MYADYTIWGGGSGGPIDDFFNGGVRIPNEKGRIFLGWRIAQCSVTYRKNVAP